MGKAFLLQKDNSKAYCKKAQGITLIALVVTIVVLLILAGITIGLVFGPNGVVKKAQEAANKTNEAVINEQAQMNSVTSTIENMLNGIGGGSGETPEEPLPEGAVQFSPVEWKNGQASTIITTSEKGYTLQYQIGGITEENWIDTTSGYEITGLTLGQTVYGRLFNGIEGSKTADITVEDLIKPSAQISLSGTSVGTTGSITATVTFTDNESGLNITGSKWEYNTNAGAIGEDESSYANSFTNNNNPQTITLNSGTAGTYYLHVLTVDNAGNKIETISDAITVEEPATPLPADGSFSEEKGVNTPNLGEEMTPIKWDEEKQDWIETESDSKWYDYSAKKWANAKTSDGSMWVWIPRYAYSIPSGGYHTSNATEISIEFMKGTSNEGATGQTIVEYNDSTTSNYTQFPSGYVIHPAFNYGETVSGLWVAKFEASNINGKMMVQPGVRSKRSINVNDIYTNCINYNKTLNSHMMKNDEWGAVAYLSRSKYGTNKEVTINSNSSYYTGGGSGNAYATTNTAQSTTGNVYGVYDMSGGAWEYVAAYVNNGNAYLTNYGSSLVNGDPKTKNVYEKGSSDSRDNNYSANKGVYGDAVYETSTSGSGTTSWYGDCSYFPNASDPFFRRGGFSDNGSLAGVFFFIYSTGNRHGDISFRPVLVAN